MLSACSLRPPSMTAAEATALANGLTPPAPAVTVLPDMKQRVPVTGQEAASVLGEFCVDQVGHALFILPPAATIQLVSAEAGPAASCNVVEEINGRKVVVCYGP